MIDMIMRLYVIIPLILLIVTVFLIRNSYKKLKKYKRGEATLIELKWISRRNNMGYIPIVEYEVNGEKYTSEFNYYSSGMKVGDKVDILYDENDLGKRVASLKGLYVAPIVLGSMTIFFFIPFILYLLGVFNF